MDGAGIDVWVGSGDKTVDAIMCIVDLMKKDSEIKILIVSLKRQSAVRQRDTETMIIYKVSVIIYISLRVLL